MRVKNLSGIGIILILLLVSCKSKIVYYENQKIITKACELSNRVNDTIVISGVYYQCMEYSGFNAIHKDSCQEKFEMDLNFQQIKNTNGLIDKLNEIEGCTGTIEVTLKGVLKNDNKIGYGHLGSNNSELILIEVINSGKVKYIKP